MKNMVRCDYVLEGLLFVRTSEGRKRKMLCFVELQNLMGPLPSHARQVACQPHAGPHKPRGFRPWPISPTLFPFHGYRLY
jgi:hypothetical protein